MSQDNNNQRLTIIPKLIEMKQREDNAAEEPPTEFIVIPFGKNETENGTYYFDDISAKSVMKNYESKGIRMMLDYHHSSLAENPVSYSEAIKAAGFYDLEIRDGNRWAVNIEYTPLALEMFHNKELKYFSPAFLQSGK